MLGAENESESEGAIALCGTSRGRRRESRESGGKRIGLEKHVNYAL